MDKERELLEIFFKGFFDDYTIELIWLAFVKITPQNIENNYARSDESIAAWIQLRNRIIHYVDKYVAQDTNEKLREPDYELISLLMNEIELRADKLKTEHWSSGDLSV